jgi:hypothetical protein
VSVLETRAAVERGLDGGRPGKRDRREHSLIVRYPKAGLVVGYSSRTKRDRVHERVVFVIGMAPGKTGTAFAFRNGKVWRVTIGVSGIFR